jgi:hypothetical protein
MRRFVVFLSSLSLLACTTVYRPQEIPLKGKHLDDQHLAALPTGKGRVTVINVTESRIVRSTLCCSGWCFFESVDSDLRNWGEAISLELKDALERLGYTLGDSAEKVIMVRVIGASVHLRVLHFKQVVSLEIVLGDGNRVEIKETKRDFNWWQGAAYESVIEAAYWIIKNKSVQEYLREGDEKI